MSVLSTAAEWKVAWKMAMGLTSPGAGVEQEALCASHVPDDE